MTQTQLRSSHSKRLFLKPHGFFCTQRHHHHSVLMRTIIISSQMAVRVTGSGKMRRLGSVAHLFGPRYQNNFTYWLPKIHFYFWYQLIYRSIASLINLLSITYFSLLLLAYRETFSFQTILSVKHLDFKGVILGSP